VFVGVLMFELCIELLMIDFFGCGGVFKFSWYGDCLLSCDFLMFIDFYC